MRTSLRLWVFAFGWCVGAAALSGCIVAEGELDDAAPLEGEAEFYDEADPGVADEGELFEETEPAPEGELQAVVEPTIAEPVRSTPSAHDLDGEVVFPTSHGEGAEETDGDPNNPDPTPWRSPGEEENPDPTPWRNPWSTQAQASLHHD